MNESGAAALAAIRLSEGLSTLGLTDLSFCFALFWKGRKGPRPSQVRRKMLGLGMLKKGFAHPSFAAYAAAVGASVALLSYVLTSRFAEGLRRCVLFVSSSSSHPLGVLLLVSKDTPSSSCVGVVSCRDVR